MGDKMENLIVLENATKIFKTGDTDFLALDNINIKIKSGQFIAIIGQSGSGKSTLMNILGGLDKLTYGKVLINGQDITSFNDKQISFYRNKMIGFIFQNFNLDNSISAIENVEMPLFYSKVKKQNRREKAIMALKKVGLENKLYQTPAKMSGGQRQRVAFARAIVNNPDIILADEPTGNLDTKSALVILKLLKEYNKQGHTVIMVTHNMRQANSLERVIEISDGKVKCDICQ